MFRDRFEPSLLTASRRGAVEPILTSIAFAPGGGVWLQLDDRTGRSRTGTYALFGAPAHPTVGVPGTIVASARGGFWVVDRDGWIHERGGAPVLCAHLSFQTGYDVGVIVGAAATPTGEGLWALGADGHVWAVGDAPRLGDVAGERTIATGIAATPSGRGYVIALHDGGVRPSGDAPRCAARVTPHRRTGAASGIALSRDRRGHVNGYWVATDDGAVFTFGAAPFLGRSGRRASPVTGIVADPSGRRYAWVHADGSIGRSW